MIFTFNGEDWEIENIKVTRNPPEKEVIMCGSEFIYPKMNQSSIDVLLTLIEPKTINTGGEDDPYNYFVTDLMYNSRGTKIIGTCSNGDTAKKMRTFYRRRILLTYRLDQLYYDSGLNVMLDWLYSKLKQMTPYVDHLEPEEYKRLMTRFEYMGDPVRKSEYELWKKSNPLNC